MSDEGAGGDYLSQLEASQRANVLELNMLLARWRAAADGTGALTEPLRLMADTLNCLNKTLLYQQVHISILRGWRVNVDNQAARTVECMTNFMAILRQHVPSVETAWLQGLIGQEIAGFDDVPPWEGANPDEDDDDE